MQESLTEKAFDLAESILKASEDDVTKLPEVLQSIYLVCIGQGVIDNGGFQYFYENDFVQNPPYSLFVEAFRRVGAEAVADCIEATAAMFPFSDPHLFREERNDWLDVTAEQKGHEFHRLSDFACGHESVWPLLDAYVLKYRMLIEDFPLPEP